LNEPGWHVPLDEDFHVHSTFSDGDSTLAENVRAARERGLRTLCLADHVHRDTTWLPEFTAAVARYRQQPGLRVLAGVEARILNTSGRLDIPPALDGIDLVLVADHQFPSDTGPVHPAHMRDVIGQGGMTAAEAIERLCEATGNALPTGCRCWPTCSACCPRLACTRTWCPIRCWTAWPGELRMRARWSR